MRWFQAVFVGVVTLLLLCGPTAAEGEPVVKAWGNFLVVTAPGAPVTPDDITTGRQLEQCRVTFSFEDTPLAEAVEFLSTISRLNFVIHSNVDADTLDVSLTLRDVTCRAAVAFVTRQVGLKWTIRHGAVLIGQPEDLVAPMMTSAHDVTHLLAVPPDFEGPQMRWDADPRERIIGYPGPEDVEKKEKSRKELMEELVVIVDGMLRADTWEASNFP